MNRLIIIVSLFFAFSNLFGQDSILVIRQYDNTKPKTAIDSLFYNSHNTIFISLDEGFDDSLYITVNGVPFLNKYLKTNESIGLAGSFGVYFDDSSEVKVLRLKFVKANRFIQEKINLEYKSLRIMGRDPWKLYYSNHFPMRE